MTSSAVTNEQGVNSQTNRQWLTLIAVCLATFMLLVDLTIVQVALPTIQRHLKANFSDLQWVIDAYALTLATLILTAGSLADRFGRKRIFVAGLSLFTLASLLCGVSTNAPFLTWSRALQGIGGAAMFATGLALIAQDFTGHARGKAIAVWGATVGGAVAVGPLVGGAITSGLGWRWIFFVNLPIGALTIWLASRRMVNVKDPGSRRLDVGGLATFSGAMFFLVLGLIRGNSDGWTSPLIVSFFVSAAFLIACFAVVELRQERPMFDFSLFRKPGFSGVSIATFAIGGGMFAMFPYATFYLQNNLGYSPLQGGLRLLPSTIPCFIVPLCVRPIVTKIPPGIFLGSGLGITAIGLALMHGVHPGSAWTVLIPGFVLTGIGIGIANPAIAHVALGVVPPERSGMASGLSNTFRIGGLAIGVAGLGALFQSRIASSLSGQLGHPAGALSKALASGGIRAAEAINAHHDVIAASHVAFVAGFNAILLIGAIAVGVGAVAAFLFVRSRDFHNASRPAEPLPPAH